MFIFYMKDRVRDDPPSLAFALSVLKDERSTRKESLKQNSIVSILDLERAFSIKFLLTLMWVGFLGVYFEVVEVGLPPF